MDGQSGSQTWGDTVISGRARVHQGNVYNQYASADEDPVKQREALLQALFWTDPEVDLEKAKDKTRNGRTPGTCKWMLNRPEYRAWKDNSAQLLLITGEPGIGKTVMSTFLVEHFTSELAESGKRLSYFFCNNREAKQRNAVAVLRGMLWQLLRAQPAGPTTALQEAFRLKGVALFESFEALWPYFEQALVEAMSDGLTLVLDGLDECEESSRPILVSRLASLLNWKGDGHLIKLKMVVTSRDIHAVADLRNRAHRPPSSVRMDSVKINLDLKSYISTELSEISRHWDESLEETVKNFLDSREGGTFIWISFMLNSIAKVEPARVIYELERFPKELKDVYARILREIPDKEVPFAVSALKIVIAAKSPLSMDELSMILHFYPSCSQPRDRIPSDAEVVRGYNWIMSCGQFFRISPVRNRREVSLLHQSVKDFLVDKEALEDLSGFYVDETHAEKQLMMALSAYFTTKDIFDLSTEFFRVLNIVRREERHGTMFGQIMKVFDWRGTGELLPTQAWENVLCNKLVLYHWLSVHEDAVICKEAILRSPKIVVDLFRESGFEGHRGFPGHRTPWARHQNELLLAQMLERGFVDVARVLRVLFQRGGPVSEKRVIEVLSVAAKEEKTELIEAITFPTPFCVPTGTQCLLVRAMRTLRISTSEAAHLRAFDLLFELARVLQAFADVPLLLDAAGNFVFKGVRRCIQLGDDVLATNKAGETALHLAAFGWCDQYQQQCVNCLLEADKAKTALTMRSTSGDTPLNAAAAFSHASLMQCILQAHQDEDCVCKTGKSNAPNVHTEDDFGVLSSSPYKSSERVKKCHLFIPGHDGWLPLHSAARSVRSEDGISKVRMLVEADASKASLHVEDQWGQTPLVVAKGRVRTLDRYGWDHDAQAMREIVEYLEEQMSAYPPHWG